MQAINFLFKVSKLINKNNNETTTRIKVFNPLENTMTVIKILENLSDAEILYILQNDKRFNYKHYQVYFTNTSTIRF